MHSVLPAQCPVWVLPCQTGLDHRARVRGREQERNRGREREGVERERGSISQRGEDDSDEKRDLKRKASRLPHGLWKFLKERKRWTVERQGELPTLNSWVILEN